MLGWLVRILFFILILFWIRLIVSKLFGSLQQRNPSQQRPRSAGGRTIHGKMVKDPHCGMYVATELAISDGSQGETVYFCSEECRREYLQEQKAGRRGFL